MTTDYKSIFIQALKNSNPGMNISKGYPAFDILIGSAADLLDSIDTELNTLQTKVDFSNFFYSDGTIKSQEYYDILKHNFFLDTTSVANSSVVVYLLFRSKLSSVTIPSGFTITRNNFNFVITAGNYPDIQWETRNGYYAAPFLAVAEEAGATYNDISAGTWTFTPNIEELYSIESNSITSGGYDELAVVNQDFINTVINNRSFENEAALKYNLFFKLSNFTPTKYNIVGLSDPEIADGIIELDDSYMVTGNTANLYCHFQLEEKTAEITAPVLENGFYIYTFTDFSALYCIKTVTDILNSPIPYKVDYKNKKLYTSTSRVKVTYYTSTFEQMQGIDSQLKNNNVSKVGGFLDTKSYFPICIYVDSSCLPVDFIPGNYNYSNIAEAVDDLNEGLKTLLVPNTTIPDVTFDYIRTYLNNNYNIVITKVLVKLPGIYNRYTNSYEQDIVEVDSTTYTVDTKYEMPGTYSGVIYSSLYPIINTLHGAPYININNKPVLLSDKNTLILGGLYEH